MIKHDVLDKKLIIVFTLIIVILTGCTKPVAVKQEAPLVNAQLVKKNGFVQTATYSGEVRSRYETQLAFQVSGKIIKKNVDIGSVVNPGDIIMEIDPKDLQQAVNLSSAQVSSAQSQLNLAKSNLDRYQQLYKANAISQAEYEQYQNAYNVAEEAVNQALAQYNQNVNQLSYTTLTTDNAGVISNVNAEVGQVVSAGQTVVTVVQDGDREIDINVPENGIEELRNAQKIKVTFWALPKVAVTGTVREISPVIDEISHTYDVRISLDNPPQSVKLGMTADVQVTNSTGQKTAFIPLAAIYQTGNTPKVWVIKKGAVTLKPVKIGTFGDGVVQVLDGLQDEDLIVTAGVNKLREGQKVRVAGDNQ